MKFDLEISQNLKVKPYGQESNQFKVKTNHEDDEKNEHNRFVLLQGEISAGNNNKQMVNEFKDLLNKFSQTGKLNQKQAKDAINVLNNISK